MDQEPVNKQIAYSASPRVGKFHIPYETLQDGGARPMLQALFGLCIILDVDDHESGRGKSYIAASEIFQVLTEGDPVPEYRIDFAFDCPFPNPEHEARRLNSGRFGFVATRQIIVRVPAASALTLGQTPRKLH